MGSRPAFEVLVGDEAEGLGLIGLEGRDPETAMITRIVLRTSGGGFSLSGSCRSTRQLLTVAAYASDTQAGAYETFRAIASDDAELEAFGARVRRR